MEFPELGKNCAQGNCKQLDFLPVKCDSCARIFCKDHFAYDSHGCPEAYRKNVQVPVCPLCNEPVAFKRGELPDIRVGEHIDRDCKADPALVSRQKIYTNRCNKKGCKTKELVKITCESCRRTFCLKHRLEADHDCGGASQGRGSSASSRAGAAAFQRFQSSQSSAAQPIPSGATGTTGADSNLQPHHLSEDEALARAVALSLRDGVPEAAGAALTEDEMLARAIAASEEEERRRRRRNRDSNNGNSGQDSRSNCLLS